MTRRLDSVASSSSAISYVVLCTNITIPWCCSSRQPLPQQEVALLICCVAIVTVLTGSTFCSLPKSRAIVDGSELGTPVRLRHYRFQHDDVP